MITATLLVSLLIPASAALVSKSIQVSTGVAIYMDDRKLDPRDAAGNPVGIFVYNGTTYLPVRAISDAVGKPTQWDAASNSVYLGSHTADKPAVLLQDLDFFSGYKPGAKKDQKDNLGNIHEDNITLPRLTIITKSMDSTAN